MELGIGQRENEERKNNKHIQNGGNGLNFDTILVIKLPDPQFLRIISRSMFLAVFILTLPCIGCIIRGLNSSTFDNTSANDFSTHVVDFEFLKLLLQDLADDDLLKKCDKALIVGPVLGPVLEDSHLLNCNEIALGLGTDLEQVPSEAFDITFAFGSEDIRFVDRVVRVGGVVVTQLSESLSNAFKKQSNYRVVYLRRYNSTIVGMKKMNLMSEPEPVEFLSKRRLNQLALHTKIAALNGLEDVLLEPPRDGIAKSRKSLKKFNFLPDLLGDSLDYYPRRVFVNVGLQEENSDAITWFNENYPSKNQEFELYSIQMVPEGSSSRVAPAVDISDWLMKNVKEDEFVVMKAEAEVVEEMMKKRTTGLVDELFLECQNQWQDEKGMKKSKRAYWECLALYGRMRDEGIAVHQWWG